jgi:hypothetical protein
VDLVILGHNNVEVCRDRGVFTMSLNAAKWRLRYRSHVKALRVGGEAKPYLPSSLPRLGWHGQRRPQPLVCWFPTQQYSGGRGAPVGPAVALLGPLAVRLAAAAVAGVARVPAVVPDPPAGPGVQGVVPAVSSQQSAVSGGWRCGPPVLGPGPPGGPATVRVPAVRALGGGSLGLGPMARETGHRKQTDIILC